MTDAPKAIRDFLLAQPGLMAVVETRIYAERDTPPPGYTPAGTGPAICFRVRGGGQDYEGVHLLPSVQFKCYGATEVEANEAYRVLYDALNDRQAYIIKHAQVETLGQTLREPETGWAFVLVFFGLLITNEQEVKYG